MWNDEFEGTEIDPAKWHLELGNGFYSRHHDQWVSGWGNEELQCYTGDPANAFIRDGLLYIRAVKEPRQGCDYTSARLTTRRPDGTALFSQTYGRFEFRARLPTGTGMWPALWMMPAQEQYGGWAASGEIDVLEARGHELNLVHGSIHFGGPWPHHTHATSTLQLPKGETIAEFHVYALEWGPGELRWFCDGTPYATQCFWWSSKGATLPLGEADLNPWPAPFDAPFCLVMNLAVGGSFPGDPDATTAFPADMVIDYVRVYELASGERNAKPRGSGTLPFSEPTHGEATSR